jgi:hypothetical protein
MEKPRSASNVTTSEWLIAQQDFVQHVTPFRREERRVLYKTRASFGKK